MLSRQSGKFFDAFHEANLQVLPSVALSPHTIQHHVAYSHVAYTVQFMSGSLFSPVGIACYCCDTILCISVVIVIVTFVVIKLIHAQLL